jgi:Na+-translocating ferredoxin:NAD+ oxidoreductase RnfA subunit
MYVCPYIALSHWQRTCMHMCTYCTRVRAYVCMCAHATHSHELWFTEQTYVRTFVYICSTEVMCVMCMCVRTDNILYTYLQYVCTCIHMCMATRYTYVHTYIQYFAYVHSYSMCVCICIQYSANIPTVCMYVCICIHVWL